MKPRSIPTADDTVIRHVQIADGICRLSLFSWARANGLKYAGVTRSFHRLMLRIPSLSEHVESVRRANVYGGPTFVDYRLDAGADGRDERRRGGCMMNEKNNKREKLQALESALYLYRTDAVVDGLIYRLGNGAGRAYV